MPLGSVSRSRSGGLNRAQILAATSPNEAPAAVKTIRPMLADLRQVQHALAPAWWAQHGADLAEVQRLDQAAGQAGRPWGDAAKVRATQRVVARGMTSARRWPKTKIAAACGITRTTLDAWTAE